MDWVLEVAPTLYKIQCEFRFIYLLSRSCNLKFRYSRLWPEYVKQRIQDTYLYFGASIGISAASAMAVFRSPTMMNLVSRGGWLAIIATFAVVCEIKSKI